MIDPVRRCVQLHRYPSHEIPCNECTTAALKEAEDTHATEVLVDVHQVDPYGIGGMSPQDLAEFRGWIEQAFPPVRKADQ